MTSFHDVPKLALPAILDPSLHKATVCFSGNSFTYNEVIALAEKLRGKSITKNFFDGAKIKALIAEQTDPFAIFGLSLHGLGATDPKRVDIRASAYNVTHPDKYTNVHAQTVEQFLENAIKK
jgi:hypothetical protein